jgi:hypothetical protein
MKNCLLHLQSVIIRVKNPMPRLGWTPGKFFALRSAGISEAAAHCAASCEQLNERYHNASKGKKPKGNSNNKHD